MAVPSNPGACGTIMSSWQEALRNRAVKAEYLEIGRVCFPKCSWLLKLLFYGAVIEGMFLWDIRVPVIK